MTLKSIHIIILTSILFVACVTEPDKMNNTDNFIFDDSIDVEELKKVEDFNYNNKNNEQLINLKLQDFYDLLALQNTHPEFTKEVKQQLKTFTEDSLFNYTTEILEPIKNLKPIGTFQPIDSVTKKMLYTYDIILKEGVKTDTIWAIISSETITVDDKDLVSQKIKFSKY